MRNTVIIIGGFNLPEGTASTIRAYGNAKLLKKIGYRVIIVGKFIDGFKNDRWHRYNGMDCYNIEGERDRYGITVQFAETLIEEIDPQSIHSFIVYNFPGTALERLRRIALKNGFAIISDTTEWYAFEGKNPVFALLRKLQTEYRMRVVNKRINNIICTTNYIAEYYKKQHTIVIPMIDDKSFEGDSEYELAVNPVRRYIYAGSPGYKFRKDKVNIIIKGFEVLHNKGIPFVLDIYGITKEEYKEVFDYIPDICIKNQKISFHGRVRRSVIEDALKKTDFYVLYRPNTKVCKVGFSTKAMEAISAGVPLIANDVNGDFKRYFTSGQALICGAEDEEGFYALLEQSAVMPQNVVIGMKKSCKQNNPFHYSNFIQSMSTFMDEVQKS